MRRSLLLLVAVLFALAGAFPSAEARPRRRKPTAAAKAKAKAKSKAKAPVKKAPVVAAGVAAGGAAAAAQDATEAPTPLLEVAQPAVDPAEVDRALEALRAAEPGEPRLRAAEALAALGAPATPVLIERLKEPPASPDADRRAVLVSIGAEVPDEKGTFRAPRREPRRRGKKPAELDWLAALAELPERSPAVLDALQAVALLRALASTQREDAAAAILDFGFTEHGMPYRDECGRQIRAMSPWSLPTLLRASRHRRRNGGAYARYATYQLDKLGKSMPAFVLAAAPNDFLEVAMLRAIQDVKHPDAVQPVLERTNSRSNVVRKAAREAWLAYVTGPPPPPAPKAKRKLPGGKLSDEEMPLYLTYRELAEIEVRRVLYQQTGEEPSRRAELAAMTRQLFDLYDSQRMAQWDQAMAQAAELAKQKKWVELGERYDEILMQDPTYAGRGKMVPGYLELGRLHAANKQWDDAVLAFHKAFSLDPSGRRAKEAETELYVARAQRSRAAGGRPENDLARALDADPEHERARAVARVVEAEAARARWGWTLVAGIAAVAAGLVLLAVALVRRRVAARRA